MAQPACCPGGTPGKPISDITVAAANNPLASFSSSSGDYPGAYKDAVVDRFARWHN